jgi:hypothetical protein
LQNSGSSSASWGCPLPKKMMPRGWESFPAIMDLQAHECGGSSARLVPGRGSSGHCEE